MLIQPTPTDTNTDLVPLTEAQAEVVQKATETIKGESHQVIGSILKIGAALWEVKEAVPRGYFQTWAERQFGWSYEHCRNLMNIHYRFGHLAGPEHKSTWAIEVSTNVLGALAAPSTSDLIREDFLKKLGDGDVPTPADVALAKAKEYVAEHGTPALQERVKRGELAVLTAERLIKNLAQSTQRIATLADRHNITDPALIPILTRMEERKSESLGAIEASGCIQGGEEPIPLAQANSRDLLDYLMEARWHHVQEGYEALREFQRVIDDDEPDIEWRPADGLITIQALGSPELLTWLDEYSENLRNVRIVITRAPDGE